MGVPGYPLISRGWTQVNHAPVLIPYSNACQDGAKPRLPALTSDAKIAGITTICARWSCPQDAMQCRRAGHALNELVTRGNWP